MVVRSKGPRTKTRKRYRKTERSPISRFLMEFNIGDRVVIKIDSSSHDGVPYRRFHGLPGKIVDKRGRAFIVEIRDGGKLKKIASNPEHLKAL